MATPETKSIPCARNAGQKKGRRVSKAVSGPKVQPIKMPSGRKTLGLDSLLYFCNYRNMRRPDPLLVTRSADRFSALGAEPRLQILRLLLSAHPEGLVAGEVQNELEIPAST